MMQLREFNRKKNNANKKLSAVEKYQKFLRNKQK